MSKKAAVALAVLAVAAIGFQAWAYFYSSFRADEGGLTATGDLASVLLAALALYAIRRAVQYTAPGTNSRELGKYLQIGLALWLLGEIAWAFQELALGISVPFPSVADIFWLLGYPFLFMAVAMAIMGIVAKPARIAAVFGLVLTLNVIIGFWVAADHFTGGADFATLLETAYAVLDVGLVLGGLAIAVLSLANFNNMGGAPRAIPYFLLACGFALHSLFDILFEGQMAAGTYYTGSPIDLLYSGGYLLIVLCGCVYEYMAESRASPAQLPEIR